MGPSPLQLSTSRVEITMSIISVTPIAFFGLYSITARSGPGATRWISARPDTTEHIVIEFDRPQTISRLVYEVEETMRERTQEVRVEVSEDGGQSYRQILVQEYNFSPGGATYQREGTALQSPPGHPSPSHDCSKQERSRHGDAHSAPPFRLEACSHNLSTAAQVPARTYPGD
jgi:hypothetical protein